MHKYIEEKHYNTNPRLFVNSSLVLTWLDIILIFQKLEHNLKDIW